MNFTPNSGIHKTGDIVPIDRRGVILPSNKEADEKRYALSLKSPRMMGKKPIK